MSGNLARLGFTLTNLPDWHAEGACNGRTDLDWYGETRREINAAKAVCAVCPIQATCLQDAIDRREAWGVWGGLDEDERAAYAKELQKPPPTIAPHGSRTRYVGTRKTPGCRCELCTRAHADYENARRVAIAARGPNWKPPTKPCDHCGEQFSPRTNPRQRFCTPACRAAHEKAKRDRQLLARRCIHCAGPINGRKSGLYCSEDCARCPDACSDPRRAGKPPRSTAGLCTLCREPRPAGRHRYCDDDCRELAGLYAADRKTERPRDFTAASAQPVDLHASRRGTSQLALAS